jgi:lysophospholipase L1-like esterase
MVRPEPWYEQILEAQAPTPGGKRARTVSGLLRHEYEEAPKPDDVYRVLLLGDSFTYGAGVDDDEKIFARIIERRLNDELPLPDIERVEVYNGGVPGGLSLHWVALFQEIAEWYDPDLVVIVFFIRDGAGTWTANPVIQIGKEMATLRERSALYRYSHAYRMFRDRRELSRLSGQYLSVIEDSYLGTPAETQEWERAKKNLRWLQQQSEARGAEFGLVIFPMLHELHEGHPFKESMAVIETFCRRADIPVHDLLPHFIGEDGPELWVSPLDPHPNERGHRIAAEGIEPFLRALIDTPVPSEDSKRTRDD